MNEAPYRRVSRMARVRQAVLALLFPLFVAAPAAASPVLVLQRHHVAVRQERFAGPSRHATWVMRFPGRLPDPRVAIERGLRQAVANMREEGEALAGLAAGSGLDHVTRLADSYERWPQTFGDRLGDALRGLRVFIVKAGTGGAMFRSLQAEFLGDAAGLLDDERVAAAARIYDRLAAEWVALAGAAQANDHEAGRPHMQAILPLEHEGVEALALAADGLVAAARSA